MLDKTVIQFESEIADPESLFWSSSFSEKSGSRALFNEFTDNDAQSPPKPAYKRGFAFLLTVSNNYSQIVFVFGVIARRTGAQNWLLKIFSGTQKFDKKRFSKNRGNLLKSSKSGKMPRTCFEKRIRSKTKVYFAPRRKFQKVDQEMLFRLSFCAA